MTIIRQAITRLETDGWVKGTLELGPSRCILGALATEAGVPMEGSCYEALMNLFPEELKAMKSVILERDMWKDMELDHAVPASIVLSFNDFTLTEFEDVISMMEEAEIRMGDIGNPVKTVEFEPMPKTVPVVEPAAPAVAPAEEPVPA